MKPTILLALLLAAMPVNAQELPDKPVPPPRIGQIIHVGEPMSDDWPANLVITEAKEDKRDVWIVKPLGSCTWCGKPMSYRHAALDKKSSLTWLGATLLEITDIELMHHAPCFVEHRCIEGNPLYGQTRGQAYGVVAALNLFSLLGQADVRRGNVQHHIGGFRYWWLLPMERYAQSSVGIASTLARWGR